MPDLSAAPPFVLFGTSHAATVLVILGVAGLLPVIARRLDAVTPVARGLALLLVVQELAKAWIRIRVYGYPWQQNLPLHLCGLASFLCAAVLVSRRPRLFEVAYFWGLAGTLQAVLTPELPVGFPHPLFWLFAVSHGGVIVAVVYATFALRLRPTWGSLPRVLVVTNLLAVAMALVNLLLGSNYLYLCARPPTASLLDHLGPWPWYILWLEVLALASFLVYYLPFAVADAVAPQRTGAPGAEAG